MLCASSRLKWQGWELEDLYNISGMKADGKGANQRRDEARLNNI
jgi:hypothetical protein